MSEINILSEQALARRENWERCAANAYQQPDEQVLAMIAEIRRLRKPEPPPCTKCGHHEASHFGSPMGSFCKECPTESNVWEHTFNETS